MSIKKRVIDLLRDTLDESFINIDDYLSDLGLYEEQVHNQSLNLFETLFALEEEFGIEELPDDFFEANNIFTVRDLMFWVYKHEGVVK